MEKALPSPTTSINRRSVPLLTSRLPMRSSSSEPSSSVVTEISPFHSQPGRVGGSECNRLFSATIGKQYATRKESSQLLQLLPILYLRKRALLNSQTMAASSSIAPSFFRDLAARYADWG